MAIANKEMSEYVTDRIDFDNNNKTVYARTRGDLYEVYSYGEHFPMYVYDAIACEWFGNSDKYSSTTSRHQSYAKPSTDHITYLDTAELQALIRSGGYVGMCADRCVDWDHIPF